MASRRILILTNRVPFPLNDGGNMAMNAMIAGYRHAGWEVFLLSMNTSRHYIPQHELANIYTDISFETVDVNNDVKPLPTILNYLFSRQPNHVKRFNNKAFADKLAQVLDGFTPDVVQIESVFLTQYLPLIKQHSNALTVLRAHNIEYQVWERIAKETRNPFKKLYLNSLAKRICKFEREAWRQYDLLLPITNVDADVMSKYASNIFVTPFGIDTTLVKAGAESAIWNCYHIGAMDWIPNAEAISWFLEDVWPHVHELHPQLEFHYAGRKMPAHFKALKVPGAICAGEVPDADAFIAGKKILVVPLRSGGGIRVKILEAMSAGKIIISTAVGMQGIQAKAGEHYLAADDAPAFLEAINWIFSHKDRAGEMARNASLLAKTRYDQKGIMEGLIGKINKMLVAS